MVVGWTPTSLAMRRQLQCVASAGFSSRVLRTISASSSGVILRGRPERGRSSSSSSTPPASYRSSHCVTVGLDTPTSRQIADPDRPSAEQRTMLALSTTRCGVVRLFTNRSKRLRSPRRNRILRTRSPMRGIYRMYLLGKRFPLHYTRCQSTNTNAVSARTDSSCWCSPRTRLRALPARPPTSRGSCPSRRSAPRALGSVISGSRERARERPMRKRHTPSTRRLTTTTTSSVEGHELSIGLSGLLPYSPHEPS